MKSVKTIICVVGARPNFMKIAPVMDAMRKFPDRIRPYLVHTGQHYSKEMKHHFFEQLGIPEPDIDLEVGSASHAVQTAEIMVRFEQVVLKERPAAVLVVGDVNSTIACALVSAKLNIPVIHVEAGLRSFDRSMPEEINRVLTDSISDLLFTTERDARDNLVREGVDDSRIHFVGNVMIDTLYKNLPRAATVEEIVTVTDKLKAVIDEQGFGVVTLHRPSNVDCPIKLEKLLLTIREISRQLPLVFPLHPRTQAKITDSGLGGILDCPAIISLPPLGYMEMLGLLSKARLVLTDSGGIQEETTALGIPCLTLRHNTERPITVEQGTNTVVGCDSDRIMHEFDTIFKTGGKAGKIPELWDGNAAQRIVSILMEWLTQ